MSSEKSLIIGVGHDANGQNVQVTLPNPGNGPIAQMAYAAMHASCGAEGSDYFTLCVVVELRFVLLGYQIGELLGQRCGWTEDRRENKLVYNLVNGWCQ